MVCILKKVEIMVEETAGLPHKMRTCRSGLNTEGKLDLSSRPAAQPPKQPLLTCPQCDSKKVWRDGLRYLDGDTIQRWLCRNCWYRFSEKKSQDFSSNPLKTLREPFKKLLNSSYNVNNECQVCEALTRGAKNLTAVESRTKNWPAGATKQIEADIEGKIVEFLWHLKINAYSSSTIKLYNTWLLALIKLGADLKNPESVKKAIALHEKWSTGTKCNIVATYNSFANFLRLEWTPPKYKIHRKLPFIPLESEIDALIAGSGKKTAALLQLLKETAMRVGEAARLLWTDVDLERCTISVNNPEKNGNPRILKVSTNLLAMLNRLPRKSKRLLNGNPSSWRTTLQQTRKRLANKLQNPRLLQIHFHTLRHWKATAEYHRTRDPYYVKYLLGHKNIQNTDIYIHLEQAIFDERNDEFHSATAKTVEEARKLLETGFQYVCTYNEVLLFRKRK